MAIERVTLFGLPVVARRRVNYARINETLAREHMIQYGLVEGDFELDLPFFTHNARLLEELESLQVRTRRGDLVADDTVRFDFYDKRIPADVCDGARLRRWVKDASRKQPKLLQMTKDDLRREGAQDVANQEFPDRIQVHHMNLSLDYHLDPGTDEDGVTLNIPKEALNQLEPQRLGWLVPGLLEEKVVALIKSLPKEKRRMFVPATDTAKVILPKLKFGAGHFEDAVAKLLDQLGNERVQASDFDTSKLPSHLRMNVRVVDQNGQQLALGRDVDELRRDLGGQAASSFSEMHDREWSRDDIVEWSIADLPAVVAVKRAGIELKGYPTLIDRGTSVSLRLLDEPLKSALATRAGLRRLAVLALKKPVKWQLDRMPNLTQWVLAAIALGRSNFKDDLVDLLVDRAFFPEKTAYPRSALQFEARLHVARGNLAASAQDLTALLNPLFSKAAELRSALAAAKSPLFKQSIDDMKSQFEALTGPNFLTRTQWPWLIQFPRYLDGMIRRVKKLSTSGAARDLQSLGAIQMCLEQLAARREEHQKRDMYDPELDLYRWMIEEYRVSIFAQELGTAMPVSDVRLAKQWEKVSR